MNVDDDTVMPLGTWAPEIVKTHASELNDTEWDVVIAGTGIQQSLLALALSRSGKRVLHIDKNEWYGGTEAAFSLQEAEEWIDKIGAKPYSMYHSLYFGDATVEKPKSKPEDEDGPKLSFSRAYTLALAPQLIYTQSRLLDALVSSKAHAQLEFLAMGSWWVYSREGRAREEPGIRKEPLQSKPSALGKLLRIPTNREDVAFSDSSISIRAKRSLMKVLRFVLDFEEQKAIWEPYSGASFPQFLSEHFKLPDSLHDLLIALTLTPFPPSMTTTSFALPRIARHLRSTGRFGPGFSSLIPKWGGISEIIQVACRSAAVGGATYVLNKSINSGVSPVWSKTGELGKPSTWELGQVSVGLLYGDSVKAKWIVGGEEDMETFKETTEYPHPAEEVPTALTRAIYIVSSPLKSLLPTVEGVQPPSGAVAVFPTGSLERPGESKAPSLDNVPPVYLIMHSSDTGECPVGQSVIYASIALPAEEGKAFLKLAMEKLLRVTEESSQTTVLWSLEYEQHNHKKERPPNLQNLNSEHVTPQLLKFPPPSMDLVFDDGALDAVKWAWLKIIGPDADPDGFLIFPERGMDEDEEE